MHPWRERQIYVGSRLLVKTGPLSHANPRKHGGIGIAGRNIDAVYFSLFAEATKRQTHGQSRIRINASRP
jgi:hypothetical protein